MHEVLATRSPSLDFQSFYSGLVIYTWLTTHVVFTLQRLSCYRTAQDHIINHIITRDGPGGPRFPVTLESPLDCKEIQPVHPKDHPWVFIGRIDAEAETAILWPPVVKSWLIWKDPDAGKDWSREWRGWQRMRCLDAITDSVGISLSKLVCGDGQGSVACCNPWGR